MQSNESKHEPMQSKEIRHALLSIIQKIKENGIEAWNADLEYTTEAVTLDDYYGNVNSDKPTAKYNGWYEDLLKLSMDV